MENDTFWMTEALALAKQGCGVGEVPVGAILVLSGERIAGAYNSPIQLHDPTAHAEILALRRGGERLRNYRLLDCVLYVTLEPCAMCAAALVQARIARLVFGAADPRVGAAGSVFRFTNEPRFNHQVSVSGGVLGAECEQVLRDFFRARRQRLNGGIG
ncbi:MAG: tRNA adenosine(34) deaminase TadA [Acidiferrobacter sp.]